ncbi:MAG TPA: biotin attachment protein, partial [Chitinophagaceae bacterium]|nr:biotin attachment protein [Chitinophagaceae bacterium]
MSFIEKKIEEELPSTRIRSFGKIYRITKRSKVKFWLMGIGLGLIVFLFIPWTQNIRSSGSITTLRQEERPQQVNSVIPGKVVAWYVKEGDFVKAGDTIIQLAEVKEDYFDPELLDRTKEQMTAKELSVENYKQKASAADQQVAALLQARDFKMAQL